METTHEPFHLDKWSLVQKKIMEISEIFIWIIISFDDIFNYEDGGKFWGYVGTSAEQLYVYFCDFEKHLNVITDGSGG
jgi:hypothetical protein